MAERLNIGLIMGSTREGRLCDRVTAWLVRSLKGVEGLSVRVIDPIRFGIGGAELRVTFEKDLKKTLAGLDGFIVVTPEYNHSFPAALKQLIDSVYTEWQTKPVGFVSYGGMSGGIRAVEQLRQVFAELHTVTLRDAVALPDIWNRFDDSGELLEAGRPESALRKMVERLRWWAQATRSARLAVPYDEAM